MKIVSVGGGMAYGALGMTHHATEDIAVMRALPNMSVYAPFDPIDAEYAIDDALKSKHPCYIRLERNNEKTYDIRTRSINGIVEHKSGADIVVLSYGSIVAEALAAASIVGSHIGVYTITKLKPIDYQLVANFMSKHKTIVSLEEHNAIGGLYSLLAEAKAKMDIDCRLKQLSIDDMYSSIVGDQKFLRQSYGIDYKAVIDIVKGI